MTVTNLESSARCRCGRAASASAPTREEIQILMAPFYEHLESCTLPPAPGFPKIDFGPAPFVR